MQSSQDGGDGQAMSVKDTKYSMRTARGSVQLLRRGRDGSVHARDLCLLALFILLSQSTHILGLASSINPVIDQPGKITIGKSYTFGQPLVRASLLEALGVTGFAVTGLLMESAAPSSSASRLVALNSLRVANASSLSYEEAYALAAAINEGAADLGACASR